MNRAHRLVVRHFLCALAVWIGATGLHAQATRRNPTSKVFVAETTGESQIDLGEKIEALVKNGVHAPEGSAIETKAESSNSLVLSNGTALFVSADTRFEVKRFLQEPFAPNRTDLDVEPSISQTLIHIVRGGIGLCTSKLVAGSSMVFQTPQASINVRGRRLAIETHGDATKVSLLEGDITIVVDGTSDGNVLRPGQQAVIKKANPGAPAVVTIQSIPESENAKLVGSPGTELEFAL